ncbi:MAG: hypothetical protein ACK4GG_12560, partial [Sphingomonas sp.]
MRKIGGTMIAGATLVLMGTCSLAPEPIASATTAPPPVAAPVAAPTQSAQARNAFRFDGPMIQGGTVLGTAPALTSRLTLDGRVVPVASDGRFLIAFDRDARPSAELVATRVDGSTLRQTLKIQPRAWRIERLTLRTAGDAVHAIASMQTRGAPLIGAVAAYGLALALRDDAS